MIALLLLVGSVWWGLELLRVSGARLTAEERIVGGTILGVATGFWLMYLLASVAGGFSPVVVAVTFAVFGATGVAARRRPRPPSEPVGLWFVVLAGVLGAALVAMNLYEVIAPAGNGYVAAEHVWADTPFHLSIVTSFGFRENYPPMYPVALGEPLGYPFLVNYVSGVLVRTGLGLRASFVTVNVIVQLAFFCAVALFTVRVTGSRRAAVLAAGTLFCLGNLGWLSIPGDVADAGGVRAWLSELPWSYTGDALGEPGRERLGTGVYLGNPTFIFFMPRRAGAFGLAVGAVLLLLFDELIRRRRVGTAVVAGMLLGLLPRIHGHTAMAMAIVLAVLWLSLPAWEGRTASWREWMDTWRDSVGIWAVMGIVAAVLALPQLLELRGQAEGFFSWWFGWTGEPVEAAQRIGEATTVPARIWATTLTVWALGWFWVLNAGFLLLLAVPAWLRADRRMRLWYLPFGALWLFANVVRTQPWEWDNNNFFVYWQFGTAVLVASWLVGFFEGRGEGLARLSRPVVGAILVVGLTLGGFLSFLFAAQQRHHLWTVEEAAFARDVGELTSADAVVLTSNGHTHPVIALSGRQVVMGFTGWLLTHGLDWHAYEQQVASMYSGNVELMRSLGVGYVVVGPWEQAFAAEREFGLSPLFDDRGVFRLLDQRVIDGREWILYELREP